MPALRSLLEAGLKEVYGVEKAALGPLDRAARTVEDEQLRKVVSGHRKVTTRQIARLEKAFTHLDRKARAARSEPFDALLVELASAMEDRSGAAATADLRIVRSLMLLEHHELARYRFLVNLAVQGGYKRVASQLEKNMGEEENAATELEKVAEALALARP